MKKNYFLFISMLLSISLSGFSTNLVLNGDFETVGYLSGTYPGTDFTVVGWNYSYGKDFFNETGNVISGTQTLRMGGGPTDGGQINQLITVEEGATYHFAYTARTQDVAGASGIGTSTGTLWANVYKGNSTAAADLIKGTSVVSNVTNSVQSVDFTVPTGVTTVRINFFKNKYLVYLDDVTLTKTITGINNPKEDMTFCRVDHKNLNIKGENISSIRIMNLLGKQVYNQPILSTNSNINMESYSSGVYIVEATLTNGNKIVSKQIIQ